jgi:hypothetical protein
MLLLLLRVGMHPSYIAHLLLGLLVFAVGLSMTLAPLAATVVADADERDAGIASAINNAVEARRCPGGLLVGAPQPAVDQT